MPAIEIRPDVFWIGTNDRTTDLFEGLWPISGGGVTYNSYVVRDRQSAVIDLSKAFTTDQFLDQLEEIIPLADVDYLVVNHLEPDHTGAIRLLARIPRRLTILATAKGKEMLAANYGITEGVRAVADGETLSLGRHTLSFHHIPFVHWPETMATYDQATQVLFSCDAFGGYGAFSGAVFDDECADPAFSERESLRYFVNIVAKFSTPVLRAIDKLAAVPIGVIAPSHGLIWRRQPSRIVELYRRWAELAAGGGERAVTLVYGSMYGNTERVMNAVAQGIARAGVPVQIFDASRTHPSYILPALWVNRGVMVGAPTYEGALFPPVAQVLDMAALKRVVKKRAAIFGSFSWSRGAVASFRSRVEPLGWQVTDALEFPGSPTAEVMGKAQELGERFARALQQD
jgi:anaerobic nitric oxide reductase flavorubredoxin